VQNHSLPLSFFVLSLMGQCLRFGNSYASDFKEKNVRETEGDSFWHVVKASSSIQLATAKKISSK